MCKVIIVDDKCPVCGRAGCREYHLTVKTTEVEERHQDFDNPCTVPDCSWGCNSTEKHEVFLTFEDEKENKITMVEKPTTSAFEATYTPSKTSDPGFPPPSTAAPIPDEHLPDISEFVLEVDASVEPETTTTTTPNYFDPYDALDTLHEIAQDYEGLDKPQAQALLLSLRAYITGMER